LSGLQILFPQTDANGDVNDDVWLAGSRQKRNRGLGGASIDGALHTCQVVQGPLRLSTRAPFRVAFTHISRRRWAEGYNYQRNLFVAFQRLCPGEIAPVVFAGRRARGLVANSGRHARAIAGVRRHWGARRRRPVRPHGDVPIRQNYCRGNADQVVQSRQHAARPPRLPVRSLASINAVVVFPTACGGRDTAA